MLTIDYLAVINDYLRIFVRYPEIDYSKHSAYANFQSESYGDCSLIASMISEIDNINNSFSSLNFVNHGDAMDALSEIQLCIDKIIKDPAGKDKSIIAKEWLDSSLRWTLSDISYEYARRVFSAREYDGVNLSHERKQQLELLRNQGMYIADLSKKTYSHIRELALRHRDKLRQQALMDPLNRSVMNAPFNSSLLNAIKLASKEAGIIDVLSDYKKNKMTVLGAGLEYSCEEQSWHQGLYSDVGLADSPLRYLHVDEGDCLPKSMIYITPVDEENGPTRAIPQSNLWGKSDFLFRMHKALDATVGARYANYVRKSHYRPIAQHAELRRIFMSLPKPFQGTSHFGDDLLVGSELTETMEKLETPYFSKGGNALVFDGPHLLHRGSLVRSGERMAIQVIYRNQNSESIKSYLAGDSLFKDQLSLAKKYARKFIKKYL
ncbi:phytanoyl-CoA dioxygenase family protein [Polynucleobacter sp. MWH-UH19D]|uniref:phytanoyl-CoA dioxygenase family protein n=1 Tax=Polynucleobacter sp. MWH-UH19D TaxID=1855610 RepID=UPI003364C375